VLARLVAAVPEVDLQCFQLPAAQTREIGIAEKRKGSVHVMARDQDTGLVFPLSVMLCRILDEQARPCCIRSSWQR
jgi:hypothetical protein